MPSGFSNSTPSDLHDPPVPERDRRRSAPPPAFDLPGRLILPVVQLGGGRSVRRFDAGREEEREGVENQAVLRCPFPTIAVGLRERDVQPVHVPTTVCA